MRAVDFPTSPLGVVFDLDGLLLDTESLWEGVERRYAEAEGASYTADVQAALRGASLGQVANLLRSTLRIDRSTEEIKERLVSEALHLMSEGVAVQPGGWEALGAVRGRIPMAIASNSPRIVVERALAAAGIRETWAAIITADDVTRHKPDPEPYSTACRALELHPAQVIALEDSPSGIRSAVAAGVYCIAVGGANGHGEHQVIAELTELGRWPWR